MPQQARTISVTNVYHVILRGVNKQQVFEDEEDYIRFLNVLRRFIENANGLIRQYIPKSSPIRHLKDKVIDEITAKINTRPRKKLNFSTPIEEFFNYLLESRT